MTKLNAQNTNMDQPEGRDDRFKITSQNNYDPFDNRINDEPLPGEFEGQERRDAETLWEKSIGLNPLANRFPTSGETELALHEVHNRLGWIKSKPAFFTRSRIAWFAAAAIVLMAFGIGFLLMPRAISTPNGERMIVELPDGSSLELNSGTTVRYSRLYGYTSRELSLDGEAFVNVQSHENSNNWKARHPFIIRANYSVIEVTGTVFNIRSRSDDPVSETRVHVTEGNVLLYPEGEPARRVQLNAGKWSRWNASMKVPMSPEPTEISEIAGWRNNLFNFRNEPIGSILREMERHFDIRIQLDADNAASETLTAHYIDPENPAIIIEDICQVKGLRFSKTANGYRIYR